MPTRWEPGQLIVRREVLGLGHDFHPSPRPDWYGRAWEALPVFVVEDTDEHLVTYIPEGAEMGFVDGEWPTPDGKHPWHRRTHWQGHGCLMVQRPGDPYAVWHFWDGPDRDFTCWYINLQADHRRTEIGYDTQDFELDFVVFPGGDWLVVLEGRPPARRLGRSLTSSRRTPDHHARTCEKVAAPSAPPTGDPMPTVITTPVTVAAAGEPPKTIREYVGRASTDTSAVSVAWMTSPPGWSEPAQRPEFDEYTVVIAGSLNVECDEGTLVVHAGEAIAVTAGERVRYFTPDGAEYLAVCVPAFAPDIVHREDED